MQIVAMAEAVVWNFPYLVCEYTMIYSLYYLQGGHTWFFQIYINLDNSSENYWIRLLIREWAQLCILVYIGYAYLFLILQEFILLLRCYNP